MPKRFKLNNLQGLDLDLAELYSNISSLSTQVATLQSIGGSLSNAVTGLQQTVAYQTERLDALEASDPPPSPPADPIPDPSIGALTIAGSQITSAPSPGATLLYTHPTTAATRSWVIATVTSGTPFSNTDTALNLVTTNTDRRAVYYNCTFHAGRYALWHNNQGKIAYINCTFEDDLDRSGNPAFGLGDESTTRFEDCSDIWFQGCTWIGHGAKHMFRVHGTSAHFLVQNFSMNNVDNGNGCMLGQPIGGPTSAVSDLCMDNGVITSLGADPFDAKKDGTLTTLVINNVHINYSATTGYNPAAIAPYSGWTEAGYTSTAR